MGICYVKKDQVVINAKFKKNNAKNDKNKSNIVVIKVNQLIDFKNKMKQIHYSSTFRSLTINSFMALLKNTKKEKTLDDKLTCFFSSYSFTDREVGLLKDIITMASKKLSIIFPKSKIFKMVCKMIFFFLAKRNNEFNKKRKKFLYKLMNLSIISFKEEENDTLEKIRNMTKAPIYSTKKISLIVTNTLLFLSYFTLYYFITPSVFEIFFDFDETQIKELLIDKQDVNNIKQKAIEQTVFHILKLINPYFSRNLFMMHTIYFVCSPVKQIILNHPTQKIFELNENNEKVFGELLQKFDEIFCLDTILDFIFDQDTKEA